MANKRARRDEGSEAAARAEADAADTTAREALAESRRSLTGSSEGEEADTLGLGLESTGGDAEGAIEPGTVVRPPRAVVRGAAVQEMVVVDELHTSVGLPGGGALYGPGKDVKVPAELARRMGLEGRPVEDEDTEYTEDVPPYDTWTKEELKDEAALRELEVTRADGEEGEPLVSDYIAALEANDAEDAEAE
jgi:hypothetical protein